MLAIHSAPPVKGSPSRGRPTTLNGRFGLRSSGTQHDAAAAVTPGSARTASSERRSTRSMAAELAVSGAASAVFSVSTLLAENPGSTWLSASDVRIKSVAPTSSTTASAISSVTSADNVRLCRRPVPLRLPASLSTRFKSGGAASAGTSANSTLVATANSIVNAAIRQSIPTNDPASPSRGKSAVFTASSARMPTNPSARPNAPPATDNSTPSASSRRRRCARPAPSAKRMATSRRRPMARINNRLATLAHAISSTNTTAPSSTHNDSRIPAPTIASAIGRATNACPSGAESGKRSR